MTLRFMTIDVDYSDDKKKVNVPRSKFKLLHLHCEIGFELSSIDPDGRKILQKTIEIDCFWHLRIKWKTISAFSKQKKKNDLI